MRDSTISERTKRSVLELVTALLVGGTVACQTPATPEGQSGSDAPQIETTESSAGEADAVTESAVSNPEVAIEPMAAEPSADTVSDPAVSEGQGEETPEGDAIAADEEAPDPDVAEESPADTTPKLVEPEVDDPELGSTLTVLGIPRSARVRIVNIKPKYHSGIRLRPGSYEVVVDAPGYVAKTRTVKLGIKDVRMEVKLSKP